MAPPAVAENPFPGSLHIGNTVALPMALKLGACLISVSPSGSVQIGNAVAPPMARKLGMCLIEALTAPFSGSGTKEDVSVLPIRDAELDAVSTMRGGGL